MKIKLLSMDFALISLWSVLFLNASSFNSEVLFGWPIQLHLTLTGALIALRLFFKKFQAKTNL
jgi:hypothetical protein